MKRHSLIDARLKKNWSQETAADSLGISTIYLRKIENGVRNPALATMLRISKVFDKSERELFPDLFLSH